MCKIENAAGGAKLHHPPGMQIGLKVSFYNVVEKEANGLTMLGVISIFYFRQRKFLKIPEKFIIYLEQIKSHQGLSSAKH